MFDDIDEEDGPPHVLIVGAGIAGLLLALLLECNGTPYEIFERAREVKPLGSLLTLNANILPALEQLGLYEELLEISLPVKGLNLYKSNMKKLSTFEIKHIREQYGYDYLVFHRPALYNLLLSRIPEEKIYFGKKVLTIDQHPFGVSIRCSDKVTHTGDILIGADGAYSGVRQSLYRQLSEQGLLPEADKKSLNKGYICMVGTTDPLDLNRFPGLDQNYSESFAVLSKRKPHTWACLSVPGNRICWVLIVQLGVKAMEDELFRNSEWSSEDNEAMLKEFYHGKIPHGNVLGDLFDATPRNLISRVMLEDKLFETWHHDRVALIGDACHKMLPSAGQGAVNAMQDAVVLANCLYDMKSSDLDDVRSAFKEYRRQRFPHAKAQYEASQMGARLQYGHSLVDNFLRGVVFSLVPMKLMQSKIAHKAMSYRPQVSFLPFVPNRGTCPVIPQKPSKRLQEQQKQQRGEGEGREQSRTNSSFTNSTKASF